jgi:hypothetical protein
MLRITAEKRPLCDGLRRRDVLRVGTAGLFGLALSCRNDALLPFRRKSLR